MRVGRIPNCAEYRIDEQFQNLPILGAKFSYSQLKNSRNLLIFQILKFCKFVKFRILKILQNGRTIPKFANVGIQILVFQIKKILEIC